MDQQVSPAVVIIVLILIVAILVGLYFLVVERGPQPDEEAGMDMAPMDGDMPPGPDEGPADVEPELDAGADQDQTETNAEQADGDSEGDVEPGDTADEAPGDSAVE